VAQAPVVDIRSDTATYEKVLADEDAFPNSSVDSERIANHCRELGIGSRFLDVGAGYGFFSLG
jgi:hypothetical protein